ncbi:MAG: hypothetical protein ACLU38_06480 [Dysosmobacter sp.]
MKELSQIRMAVLDALRGPGFRLWRCSLRSRPWRTAAWLRRWVSARPAENGGLLPLFREMKDPETQAVRERYGKELFGQITVELRANRAADCERGCETATEVLLGGLPEGVRTGELTWEAICWEKTTECSCGGAFWNAEPCF